MSLGTVSNVNTDTDGWPVFLTTFSPQSYLNTFAFSNTVYTDLWDHLQQVSLMPNLLNTTFNNDSVHYLKHINALFSLLKWVYEYVSSYLLFVVRQ